MRGDSGFGEPLAMGMEAALMAVAVTVVTVVVVVVVAGRSWEGTRCVVEG